MNFKKASLWILVLGFSGGLMAQDIQTNKYFRHLRYNHVSPYIKLAGTYPIQESIAKNTSHYLFSYNKDKKLVSITNYHYFTERMHPLATIGAYKTVITHTKNTETRIFFDKNKKRITNDKGVFKEQYTLDKKGTYSKLEFFDLDNQPMESDWNISEYHWSKKGKMVIEKRFNLKGEPMPLSSYFKFGITGMLFKIDGTPIANYNLNNDLQIVNNATGVASYQDSYGANGNHIKYTYHDSDNKLVMSQYGFSVGKKEYDALGNYVKQELFDPNLKFLRGREITSNQHQELSKAASKKDSLDIKRISLGYLISLQELKPDLMNEVMNDSLNKVTVGYNNVLRKEVVTALTKKRMIENATSWNKSNSKFPPTPNNQVKILDIYHRIATVKLTSDNWVEYLHLIKLNDTWSIINLLWQHKNVRMYPY